MLSSKVFRATPPLAAAWVLLRRLLYGAFVVALVALAAALALAVVPRLFGYGTLVVYGGSMSQTMPNGSLVIVRQMAAADVELGDVIIVQEESEDGRALPKIHRVVSLDEEGGQLLVRTKGDANSTPDPNVYILPDHVMTPAHTLPYLGYLVGFAVTPLGWMLLVAIPGTTLCLLTLRGIWSEGEKPATKPGTAYDSGWSSFRPPSGPRRRLPAPPLLPLAGGSLIALLVGLVLLVVWLTDSDGNSPEEAASNAVPSATAAPSATPPATPPSLPRLAAPVPESQGALFRLAVWDGNEWQFNLTPEGPVYGKGEAVPFLLRIDRALPATAYTFTIHYDCIGIDFLTAYDRDAGSEPALATGGPGSPIVDSAAPVPDDPATPADDQEAGSFSLWGGPFTRVDAPLPSAACTGENGLTVGLSAAADTVFLMWAAQLSDEASNRDVPLRLAVQTPGGGELSVEIDR